MNLKSAEKGLQFGTNKCKTMIIGRKTENVKNNSIYVDGWDEEYVGNAESSEIELKEKYVGKIPIQEVENQKYLGFMISSKGNNLENIKAMEKKAI